MIIAVEWLDWQRDNEWGIVFEQKNHETNHLLNLLPIFSYAEEIYTSERHDKKHTHRERERVYPTRDNA